MTFEWNSVAALSSLQQERQRWQRLPFSSLRRIRQLAHRLFCELMGIKVVIVSIVPLRLGSMGLRRAVLSLGALGTTVADGER
jgi:hypothetical protein